MTKFYHREQYFIENFQQELVSEDQQAARRYAHTLKGVAGSLGASRVQSAAAALEIACQKLKEDAELAPVIDKVAKELTPVLAGIVTMKANDSNSKTNSVNLAQPITLTVISPQELNGKLKQLTSLLTDCDTEALDLVSELQQYSLPEGLSTTLKNVAAYIDEFDFDLAQEVLSKTSV